VKPSNNKMSPAQMGGGCAAATAPLASDVDAYLAHRLIVDRDPIGVARLGCN
jgi:hypothetical protein